MPSDKELGNVERDRQTKLEKYYTWGLTQIKNDK